MTSALDRWPVMAFAEEELDRVAEAVDGAIGVHPFAWDLDVRLVQMLLGGNAPLAGYHSPNSSPCRHAIGLLLF